MANLKNPHFPTKLCYLTDMEFSVFQYIGLPGLVNQQGIE